MCATDGSELFDVWEDGNRAPIAIGVTASEADALVNAAPLLRQKCCGHCGLIGLDIDES